MEFRCRLVSADGDLVEGVYSAENESRLRQELEEKGLHVLSLRARGSATRWLPSLVSRRRVARHEFLVFNQELATLLKAGMPLVQSLSALIYPAILVVLSVALVLIIVLRVVPAFSDFYASFGAELPLSTRVIMGVSDLVLSRFPLILAGLVAGGAALAAWLRQPGQRLRLDRGLLRLPFVGGSLRKFS